MPDTKSTTLFSLAAVKTYLQIKSNLTDDDALLIQLADGVSARVEAMTSRKFVSQAVTERFDGRGRDCAFLRHMPVSAVTEVKRRPDLRGAWEVIPSGYYEVDALTGRLQLAAYGFYCGPLTAEVTYTTGYGAQDAAALPGGLVEAALSYVEFVYKRKKAGLIVGSASMGGASIAVVPEPPKDVRDAIMAHKKFRGLTLG